MTRDAGPAAVPGFLHSALIVDSDESMRQVLVPAVRRAMTEADGVFLVVAGRTASLLREELGAAAAEPEWGDTGAFYQRLGFAYEGFRRFLAAARAAGRSIHVFAEANMDGDAGGAGAVDRTAAYLAYEAICNETYAAYGCAVTCLWDVRRHSTLLIEDVRVLHNRELGPDGRSLNRGRVAAREYLAGRNELPLPLPGWVDLESCLAGQEALPVLRAELRAWACRQGFAAAAVSDLILAVNEIATNGLAHGRPPVEVRGWHHDDTLIVQADDHGGIPLPATGGYEPPCDQRTSRRGLWLARQLADVVQTHTAGTTTSVRLYFPHELTHRRPPLAAAFR